MRGGGSGFSLVEALVALALVAVVLTGILPAFLGQQQANRRNDLRTGAIAAAQQVMEELRVVDPVAMPESGTAAPQLVTIGSNEYAVAATYCANADFCDTGSRHVLLEVTHDGERLYTVETVYTQLR